MPPRPASIADRPYTPDPSRRGYADVAKALTDDATPARTALLGVAGSLQTPTDEVLLTGVRLHELLKRNLPSSKGALNDRLKPATEFRALAQGLQARLSSSSESVRAALEQAGEERGVPSIIASRFDQGTDNFNRRLAAGRLADAAEDVEKMHQWLLDNLGKWSVNARGEITTKDRTLQSSLFFARSAYDRAVASWMENLRDLAAGQPLPDPKAKPAK